MATNTLAKEEQVVALPYIAMPTNRTSGIPTNKAIGNDVGLSGLNIRRRTTSR